MHNTASSPAFPEQAVLLQTSALPLAAMFGMCSLFLVACAVCQRQLARLTDIHDQEFELSDSNVNLLSTVKKSYVDV